MDKSEIICLCLFVVLVAFIAFNLGKVSVKEEWCESLGGAYMNYTCVSGEFVIKLQQENNK